MSNIKNSSAVVFLTLALAACGGGSSAAVEPFSTSPPGVAPVAPAPVKSTVQSISAIVAKLENEGQLPKLDRTDTLLGIDANGDGIRDDIEVWIAQLKLTDQQKNALRQVSRSMRAVLSVDLNDNAALESTSLLQTAAIVCMVRSKADSLSDGTDVFKILRGYTYNTRTRVEKSLRYDRALSGSVSILPPENTCI